MDWLISIDWFTIYLWLYIVILIATGLGRFCRDPAAVFWLSGCLDFRIPEYDLDFDPRRETLVNWFCERRLQSCVFTQGGANAIPSNPGFSPNWYFFTETSFTLASFFQLFPIIGFILFFPSLFAVATFCVDADSSYLYLYILRNRCWYDKYQGNI